MVKPVRARKKHKYPLLLVKVVFFSMSLLPLALARYLGIVTGKIAWRNKVRSARTTQQNISHCYPDWSETERVTLAKESLAHTGQSLFEVPIVWCGRVPRLRRWIKDVEGEQLLRDALADKGAIVIPLHFGNWEFLTVYLTTVAPFLGLYSAESMSNLQAFITYCRSRFGADFAEADVSGVLKVRRYLKNKGMVAIFPDQLPLAGASEVVDMLGKPAKTSTTIPHLVKRSGVPALLAAAIRKPGGFHIQINKPRDALYSDDLLESTLALNQSIEDVIQRDLAQYQWEYKRYREVAQIYQ